mgnify:CR=1 FL=1
MKKQKSIIKPYRITWEDMGLKGSPVTKIVPAKKGKGSYKREKFSLIKLYEE